jgi:hypothetical protein
MTKPKVVWDPKVWAGCGCILSTTVPLIITSSVASLSLQNHHHHHRHRHHHQAHSINDVLRDYEPFGGVAFHWRVLGSSGHRVRPDAHVAQASASAVSLGL